MTTPLTPAPELLAMVKKITRGLIILTLSVGVVGLIVGFAGFDLEGLWAALIAFTLGVVFTAITGGGLRFVTSHGQDALMLVVFGGWLLKMVILAGVLIWLKSADFYHKGTFASMILVLLIGALIVEMVIVATNRVPYTHVNSVTQESGDGDSDEQ